MEVGDPLWDQPARCARDVMHLFGAGHCEDYHVDRGLAKADDDDAFVRVLHWTCWYE